MVAFAFLTKAYFNVFVNMMISGFIYLLVLFLLKGFVKEDIFSIVKSFSRK
jgi:hypothetical protein